MKHLYTFVAGIGLTACCVMTTNAQQTKILSADKNNEYGLVYSLPVTDIVVEASCEVINRVPGPYRQYAKRYLGKEEVVKEQSSRVSLTDIKAYTRGSAGEDKYLMQLKPGALTRICVAEDGMLLSINTEEDAQEETPVLRKGVEVPEPDMEEYLQYVDADYLASLSSAKRAQMLAETIMEIRESRLSLSRGTAETMPADGRQLELMLASLEKQENALTRAFNGYEYTTVQTGRYVVRPDSTWTDGELIVLFRLSETDGLCDADDYSGEPVYISLNELEIPEMPVGPKGEPKAFPKDGVVYTLPGTASITVEYKGSTVAEEQMAFAQFGIKAALDPKLFTDKRAPSCAVFNPNTGALLRLSECEK